MAFRAIRDRDTGELVIRYDPVEDRIEYLNRRGKRATRELAPYRVEAIEAKEQTPRAPREG